MKNYKEAKKLIDNLNSLYRQMPQFGYKTDKEMLCKFPKESARLEKLSTKFDATLSALREMGQDAKFDARGSYYLKYDENGREQFLMRVRTIHEGLALVPAINPEIAKKKALLMAKKGQIGMQKCKTEVSVGNF